MTNTDRVWHEASKDFRKALRAVNDDMADLKAVHKDAAEIVARRSAQIVPTGATGMLRDSIDSRGTQTKGYVRAGSKAVVPYAGAIHFGWPKRNIKPQPFIYTAMDQRRGEVLEQYSNRLENLIRMKGL
jgi:HK97 gp10 family phage protein